MNQTAIEKITQRWLAGPETTGTVTAGDYVRVCPAHVMTHDNTSAVMQKFRNLGARRVADPQQPVCIIDHNIQDHSPQNQAKYAAIRDFAEEQGIQYFPPGAGIGHQIILEEGFARPGVFVVASDSHANMYGAVACLGTPVVRTDAAAIWATGETWWQVPETVQVHLEGSLPDGCTGKDIILALCGRFCQDEVLNCGVEFTGPGVATLSMDDRMTIANMTTEWGALIGLFPYDSVTEKFMKNVAQRLRDRGDAQPRITEAMINAVDPEQCAADPGAEYFRRITVDLNTICPYVTGPNNVKTTRPVTELAAQNIAIQKAYLLSCVNGRLVDFQQAAAVMAGRTIHPGVAMYIAAASATVQQQAEEHGYWKTLLDAGATPLPPGCGPCIGLGDGILGPNETGISATNRNFQGRMGDRSAKAYLAAPAVVAASAVAGKISAPEPRNAVSLKTSLQQNGHAASRNVEKIEMLHGMPAQISGRALWLPADNMNTDGIYGSAATYRDDLTPDQMAAQIFRNYDPEFQRRARAGDILIGGMNFGTGSSREQAATALKFFGIPLVLAGSFSQTYKRNAFNNGLLCLESPELIAWCRRQWAEPTDATVVTGMAITVDLSLSSVLIANRRFRCTPLSRVPQELIVAGGLEALLKQQGQIVTV